MDRPPSSKRGTGPAFARNRSPTRAARVPPKPLARARLEEMALAYVARFATSAGKLRQYLNRKLRERGWEEAGDSDPGLCVEALVERFVALGYVDDESFARGRTGSLLRRGFGRRRINEALGAAGIDADTRNAVMPGEGAQRQAALALARKRRFGPFGTGPQGEGRGDPALRQKQMAAMLRAGHSMDATRALLDAGTEEEAENWAAEADDDTAPAPGSAGNG